MSAATSYTMSSEDAALPPEERDCEGEMGQKNVLKHQTGHYSTLRATLN